jgi:hypothetical protein
MELQGYTAQLFEMACRGLAALPDAIRAAGLEFVVGCALLSVPLWRIADALRERRHE